MMNWSEGVDSAICSTSQAFSILICRAGRRTCTELSSKVSTVSFWERALAGLIAEPGV